MALLAAVGSCGPRLLDLRGAARVGSRAAPQWAEYAVALDRSVRTGGVDYHALVRDPAPLNCALASLVDSGPTSTPDLVHTRADRLAYWINAYNLAVLRSVVELVAPDPRHPDAPLPRRAPRDPSHAFRFVIDLHPFTPAELRRRALAAAGDDWRVRFALCGGHAGDPPLYPRPFHGDLLDSQLDEQVRRAFSRTAIVSIDHGDQRLRISAELAALRQSLIADFRRRTGAPQATLLNVLLEHADPARRRELNAAVGYALRVLPFDSRLNHAAVN